nr:phosphatidylcholine:diacylglycerol cholinephosphotransferase 1 [Quercus suber]
MVPSSSEPFDLGFVAMRSLHRVLSASPELNTFLAFLNTEHREHADGFIGTFLQLQHLVGTAISGFGRYQLHQFLYPELTGLGEGNDGLPICKM